MNVVHKDSNCSPVISRWFEFVFTEEIYAALKDSTISEADRVSKVYKICGTSLIRGNPRSDLFFEFYYQVVSFCSEGGFNFIQSQLFLSLVGEIFERSMIPHEDSSMPSPSDATKQFYDSMMSYILDKPEEKIFSTDDVGKLSSFFYITFAQNVRAFQFVCQELQSEVVEQRLLSIQTPLVPMSTILASSTFDFAVNSVQ